MLKRLQLNSGVIVPIITPHIRSDIFSVIDHIQKNGISMIFLLGTTGEALKIPHEEKKDLIRTVASYIKSDIQLLVGITSRKMNETIELMEIANEVKTFASVISPLVVNNESTVVIKNLLASSAGNLLLYNYPAFSEGRHIPIQDITSFCSESRILGIKDSSGDFSYLDQLLNVKKINKDFKVYFGPEQCLSDALEKNIDGFVPGSGNLEPGLASRIWKEKHNAPWKEWFALKDLIKQKDENYISAIKKILKDRELISSDE